MRLFVGIPVYAPQREVLVQQVSRYRERLEQGMLGSTFSWVPIENYHVTLKFLGAAEEGQIPAISEAVTKVAAGFDPFKFTFAGLGTFGGRNPQALWIGVTGADARIRALAASVERAFEKCGFPSEKREFSPHLTIAKNHRRLEEHVSKRLGELLRDTKKDPVPGATQLLSELVLYESVAARGVQYQELATYPLAGS